MCWWCSAGESGESIGCGAGLFKRSSGVVYGVLGCILTETAEVEVRGGGV